MTEIASGIEQVDTLLGGWEQMTAGFVISGPNPALVETGSQSSVPAVQAALQQSGLGPQDLRWIIVTHIHLDHAGGVGDLAQAFPSATVIVHENGARHLQDPSRLISSAARVYGPLLDDLYGRMSPVPEGRLVAAADGYTVDIGDSRHLTMVDSPGHAKHHHAVLDSLTGTLLVGDAVGVRLPDVGVLRPATPPPEFDLEAAVASLARFRELKPTKVVLTHYGPVENGEETLLEAEEMLHRWVDLAEKTLEESSEAGIDDVAGALADAFAQPPQGMAPEHRDKLEVLNGVHSNAAGIVRYLNKKAESERSPN